MSTPAMRCGAVKLASGGSIRVLGWRSSALAPRRAYGAIDAPGRVDLDEYGFAVPSGGALSEVAIAP